MKPWSLTQLDIVNKNATLDKIIYHLYSLMYDLIGLNLVHKKNVKRFSSFKREKFVKCEWCDLKPSKQGHGFSCWWFFYYQRLFGLCITQSQSSTIGIKVLAKKNWNKSNHWLYSSILIVSQFLFYTRLLLGMISFVF